MENKQSDIFEIKAIVSNQNIVIPIERNVIGKDLIKNNEFYKDLAKIMTYKPFRKFIKKYFSDSMDANTSLMFMGLYSYIEDQIKSKYPDVNITQELIISMIDDIMNNSETRRSLISTYNQETFKNLSIT